MRLCSILAGRNFIVLVYPIDMASPVCGIITYYTSNYIGGGLKSQDFFYLFLGRHAPRCVEGII